MATSNFAKNPLVGSEADELLLLLQYLKLTARSSTPAVDKLPSVKFPQWSEKAVAFFLSLRLWISSWEQTGLGIAPNSFVKFTKNCMAVRKENFSFDLGN